MTAETTGRLNETPDSLTSDYVSQHYSGYPPFHPPCSWTYVHDLNNTRSINIPFDMKLFGEINSFLVSNAPPITSLSCTKISHLDSWYVNMCVFPSAQITCSNYQYLNEIFFNQMLDIFCNVHMKDRQPKRGKCYINPYFHWYFRKAMYR